MAAAISGAGGAAISRREDRARRSTRDSRAGSEAWPSQTMVGNGRSRPWRDLVARLVASFTSDGAYDQDRVGVIIPVPRIHAPRPRTSKQQGDPPHARSHGRTRPNVKQALQNNHLPHGVCHLDIHLAGPILDRLALGNTENAQLYRPNARWSCRVCRAHCHSSYGWDDIV
jgi:hypothetical protein